MKLPVNGFDLAYMAVLPPAALAVGYKMARHGKYRESAPALVGLGLEKEDPAPWRDGCVWVHAVSVGEVIAARAMLPLLRERFAGLPILLTTHTETGQAMARSLPEGMADAVRYYPLDFSWLLRRYVKLFRPKFFLLMETELWPNALNVIANSGAQVFTLNGKISENSFKSYQRIGGLIRGPLSRITAFCAQTEQDRDRMAALLGNGDHVHVTGNCKFDVEIPTLDERERAELAREMGVAWPSRVVVAGSTHGGEEEMMLAAFREIEREFEDVHMMIVPRHPERFGDVWNLMVKSGLPVGRVSDGATAGVGEARVHLVDRMGVLTRLYGLAEVAIVAGSFVGGIGGHNIMEPAAHGAPVIYGPDMKGQPDMKRILSPANGGTVAEPGEIGRKTIELLAQPDMAREKGETGRRMYEANRGSARRNMDVLEMYLNGGGR